ncbi:MAG: RNA-directed DNA polymerase [Gallionella sp.]|nr:RNA-directed DNA polymerase [Gallionella sp.]
MVPNNAGTQKKPWIIPSVNDQILLQVVASSLAERIEGVVDPERVFSYRYNTDPNRLQLTDSQISSWSRFQNETQLLLRKYPYVLQIDLEGAFRSIDQIRFFEFFDNLFPGSVEVDILKILISSFSKPDQGLPLINDSLFFLGNAYLSRIDSAIRNYTTNFIRFVDDYRIFGASQEQLEEVLTGVSRELQKIGFKINSSKLKMGSSEEYLEAIAKAKYASTKGPENSYISAAVVFDDVVKPELMVELVARAVENPDKYMNEGYGRLILGAIRRMRLNNEVALMKNYNMSPLLDEYRNLLSGKTEIINKAIELLHEYAHKEDEAWRTVWIIFVMHDVQSSRLEKVVRAIQKNDSTPPIVRLWASRLWSRETKMAAGMVEELHDINYLDAGKRFEGRRST